MNIQLTISLLVSDRMDTLERCMASLKPLLRELDSELIAVFTGKNDETLKLIEQYAALVIPFTWCDDFAKARNAGLEQARGEWFLFLDDDEWFDNTEEIIQFFKTGEYRNFRSAFYQVRNYFDWEWKTYSDASVARMCRRTGETRFVLPIHEYLYPFPEPHKNFQCFVHHVGYIDQAADARKESSKSSRNLPMLLERLEKADGFDAFHCCMQLAQEYRNREEYETAVEYCEKGLKIAGKQERVYAPEMWMQAYLPTLLFAAGEPGKALERGESLLKSSRVVEVCSAHIAATLVILCYELKEYKKGLKYVRLFHQRLLELRRQPEKATRQRSGDITFSFVEGRALVTYLDGLIFAAEIEDLSLIKTILSWMPWDDTVSVSSFYPNLEAWKTKYEKLNDTILEGYFYLKTDNVYVSFQKALFAEKNNQPSDAKKCWELCIRECPDQLLCQAVEMAVRNRFLLNPLIDTVTMEVWEGCVRTWAERIPSAETDSFYEDIVPLLGDYPLYISKLEQGFLEKRLSQGIIAHSELVQLLHRYCDNLIAGAKKIYRDEVLYGSEIYALPSQYRFAFLTDKILGLIECGQFADCIPFLKETLRIAPGMSVIISQLSRYLTEQIETPPQTVSKEFELLGGQVKQVLTGLMENRQWQDAYGVTGRLVTLLPDDLEVLRMKQIILREGM